MLIIHFIILGTVYLISEMAVAISVFYVTYFMTTVVPLYNAALYSAVCFIRRVCHGPRGFFKQKKLFNYRPHFVYDRHF
jgi:hypothetical protein